MRIVELLLPKNASTGGLSPKSIKQIDVLQQRMNSYVDKIMSSDTSSAGREFLKSRLRDDYNELRDLLPRTHTIAEHKIYELFQSGQRWRQTYSDSHEFIAEFKIKDKDYIFHAYQNEPGLWAIEFLLDEPRSGEKRNNKFGILNTGDSVKVFSTVVDIMREFMFKYSYHIKQLIFSADEPSRKKLYKSMIKRLLPKWRLEQEGHYDMILTKPEEYVYEAVTKLPLTHNDFELVKKVMEQPIPAVIAPIYISEIIDDDELNDQIRSLEESEPDRDVRPLIAGWFNRVMPDQMYRFTNNKNIDNKGQLSPIHGYSPGTFKGSSEFITGNAYGRF